QVQSLVERGHRWLCDDKESLQRLLCDPSKNSLDLLDHGVSVRSVHGPNIHQERHSTGVRPNTLVSVRRSLRLRLNQPDDPQV
ncbi:unnamed protein product, partial [Aphanomyces euteiches]